MSNDLLGRLRDARQLPTDGIVAAETIEELTAALKRATEMLGSYAAHATSASFAAEQLAPFLAAIAKAEGQ